MASQRSDGRAFYFCCGLAAAAAAAALGAAARAYLQRQRAAECDAADAAAVDCALGTHHPATPPRPHPTPHSRDGSPPLPRIDSSFPTGGASLKSRGAPPAAHLPEGPRQVAPPVIVGVAGASGSGKTCIAQLIEQRLGGAVRVVSVSSDAYYRGLQPGLNAADHNWDHPDALDMELLAAHLECLRNGKDVHVPEYDFSQHRRDPARTTFVSAHDTDVVIVDGIFVLAVEQLRKAFDLTLFTVEELDVCLARRLRRDIAERGRSIESVLAQYLRFVRPGYINFIEPVRACFLRFAWLPGGLC